jgi:very-short-patch-repair endonuclease
MTFAEERLWSVLKSGKLGGFKFRRQHPVGSHIVDFCCIKAKIIVELDGDAHLGREYPDRLREDDLRNQGYEVIRFENCDTKYDETHVAEIVLKACQRGIGKIPGEVIGPKN